MSVWYFLEKGRPRGPVNAEFILAEIRAGRLQRQDLLYRERDTQWRELQSFAEFQKSLGDRKLKPSTSADCLWVLLTRKTDGGGYKQSGPFSTTEIVRQLKDGKITVTDYLWREGLKEWYKILAVSEIKERLFDPEQLTRTEVPIPVPIPTSVANAASVEPETVTAEVAAPKEPPTPKEAVVPKEALVRPTPSKEVATPAAAPKELTATKKIRPGRAAPKAADNKRKISGQRVGAFRYFMDMPPVRRTFIAVVSFISIVGLIFFVFWFSSYLDRSNSRLKRPTAAQVPPSKLSPVATVAPSKAAPLPNRKAPVVNMKANTFKKQAVAVIHQPTYLHVQKLDNGSVNPVLRINTDASPQIPVQVQLSADGGYVLDHPSFFTKKTVHLLENHEVQLGDWHLPWGVYRFAVDCGPQTDSGVIRVGTAEKGWLAQIRQERKNEIFAHNIERVGFIKTADHLALVTAKLAEMSNQHLDFSNWHSFYRGWRMEFGRIRDPIMSRINNRNRDKYLHPIQWMDLRDLRKDIDRTSKAINKAKIERRDSGRGYSQVMRQLRLDARQAESLKEQMIRTSIMR